MAQNTLSSALSSHAGNQRHLHVVTEADVRAAREFRQLQWEAMKAGYPAPVRLTKRGRRLITVLVLLPIAALFWINSSHGVSAADTNPTSVTVVVQPGQNLWDVAAAAKPAVDPRNTVFEIKQINHLTSSNVSPGQALIVPLGQ